MYRGKDREEGTEEKKKRKKRETDTQFHHDRLSAPQLCMHLTSTPPAFCTLPVVFPVSRTLCSLEGWLKHG